MVPGRIICALLIFHSIGCSLGFDCITQCFGEYDDSEVTCDILERAKSCYEDNDTACDDASYFVLAFHINSVRNRLQERNCSGPTTTTVVSTPPPASVSCPGIPAQVSNVTATTADIEPEGNIPNICQVSGRAAVSHCSLFMHSHLRPFHFHATPKRIQTCSLPGAWQLFRHQHLMVEVEGSAEQVPSLHTQLTKVTVTFPGVHNCNCRSKIYTAYNTAALPSSFLYSTEPHYNTDSPLQLHLSADGSVVTLLASWLNSSVIIRKIEGFLAVTLKVTGAMAFESEGLCTGCPQHQYVDALSYSNSLKQNCQAVRNRAAIDCFSVNTGLHTDVNNLSYSDACIYSMLKADSSYVRMMVQGIAEDAQLLADSDIVPLPRPAQPLLIAPAPSDCLSTTAVVMETSTMAAAPLTTSLAFPPPLLSETTHPPSSSSSPVIAFSGSTACTSILPLLAGMAVTAHMISLYGP